MTERAYAQSEGDPMDAVTAPESEVILQRLEALVTELEHDPSVYTFYLFVLVAEAFAGTKPPLTTLAHIRRCVTLAHRMRAIRAVFLPAGSPWNPLTALIDLLHAEATRLTTLYGVARPACRTRSRELRQALHAAFTQATGKVYQTYGPVKTAKERTTITAFWDEALRTALAQFQATGTADTLDAVIACLPAWADRHHERWGPRGWREPAPPEVMQRLTEYLRVCEACLGTMAQIAAAAVAAVPVVERAQVAPAIEQEYAAPLSALRAQLRSPHGQAAPLSPACQRGQRNGQGSWPGCQLRLCGAASPLLPLPPWVRQRARTAAAPCRTHRPPGGCGKAPAPLRSARAEYGRGICWGSWGLCPQTPGAPQPLAGRRRWGGRRPPLRRGPRQARGAGLPRVAGRGGWRRSLASAGCARAPRRSLRGGCQAGGLGRVPLAGRAGGHWGAPAGRGRAAAASLARWRARWRGHAGLAGRAAVAARRRLPPSRLAGRVPAPPQQRPGPAGPGRTPGRPALAPAAPRLPRPRPGRRLPLPPAAGPPGAATAPRRSRWSRRGGLAASGRRAAAGRFLARPRCRPAQRGGAPAGRGAAAAASLPGGAAKLGWRRQPPAAPA